MNIVTQAYSSNKEERWMDNLCDFCHSEFLFKGKEELLNKQLIPQKLMIYLCKRCQLNLFTKEQEEFISELVVLLQQYEWPSKEDLENITAFPLGNSEIDNVNKFKHMVEMTTCIIQLIVEFSKRVPGFDTLSQVDQTTLLKAVPSEAILLKTARKYDMNTDSLVFDSNQSYTREDYRHSYKGEIANHIFDFCRTIHILKVDVAEYALLSAIIIFSKRPFLFEPKKVEKIRAFYLETLRSYTARKRPSNNSYFDKLLFLLGKLNTLGNSMMSISYYNRHQPSAAIHRIESISY